MTPGDVLIAVLEEARDRFGFLGPGPVVDHVTHAEAYASALDEVPDRVVDLGSGAGLPGLVLARVWVASTIALVDAEARRVDFLRRAIERLGLGDRVTAQHARAEDLGRAEGWRGQHDAVVARSFGPPAVVAECASPLLRVGGALVVSEPPEPDPGRWPPDALRRLGLTGPTVTTTEPRLAVLRQAEPCPERFPRRAGVPERRPLF